MFKTLESILNSSEPAGLYPNIIGGLSAVPVVLDNCTHLAGLSYRLLSVFVVSAQTMLS